MQVATSVPPGPLSDDASVPPGPLSDDASVPPGPLSDDASVPPGPLSDDASVPPVPLSDDASVPPVPLLDDASVPPVPLSDDASVRPVPLSDDASVPPVPLSDDASLIASYNLQKITEKFASVIVLARDVLQEKNISVPDLRLVLVASYRPSEENNDTREINPSKFIRDVLGTAQSIGEAFEALMYQNLMSFKNYHLLRLIVSIYASEISAKLNEYEDELGGYVLVTKIQDYLDAELEQTEQAKPDPKLFDELSVKVKVNVTEKTMEYVSELWTSLGRRIGLPLSALPLHRVAKGCIKIVWLLPSHLTQFATLQVQENTNYFREENVLRVTIAGRCIYDEGTDPSREVRILRLV